MQSIKSFFKIVGYEITKVLRNKIILIMLVSFSILLLVLNSFANESIANPNIGVCKNGIDISNSEIIKVIDENTQNPNYIDISSLEQGKQQINLGKIDLFVYFTNSSPVSATLYYDETSNFGYCVVASLAQKSSDLIQGNISDYLREYGITVNQEYFQVISFESTNLSKITFQNKYYTMIITVSIGIVLMFGIAYSTARDNETQTIKNISYMPMGANRYLLSKMFPYLILGLLELVICVGLGAWLYNIDFQLNPILIILICFMFVISTICLALLLSMMKSQIATCLVSMFLIIYPLFAYITTVTKGIPVFIQYIFYLIPGMSFMPLFNGMAYNGVVIFEQVLFLIAQIVIYYFCSWLILKRKTEK